MEILSLLTNNVMLLLTVIGMLAFTVSVITEVTKDVWIFKKIPTDLQVIVLSIILCQMAYFIYISYTKSQFQWYYCFIAFVAAFIVSFVAMYGWEKLTTLYGRFKK